MAVVAMLLAGVASADAVRRRRRHRPTATSGDTTSASIQRKYTAIWQNYLAPQQALGPPHERVRVRRRPRCDRRRRQVPRRLPVHAQHLARPLRGRPAATRSATPGAPRPSSRSRSRSATAAATGPSAAATASSGRRTSAGPRRPDAGLAAAELAERAGPAHHRQLQLLAVRVRSFSVTAPVHDRRADLGPAAARALGRRVGQCSAGSRPLAVALELARQPWTIAAGRSSRGDHPPLNSPTWWRRRFPERSPSSSGSTARAASSPAHPPGEPSQRARREGNRDGLLIPGVSQGGPGSVPRPAAPRRPPAGGSRGRFGPAAARRSRSGSGTR